MDICDKDKCVGCGLCAEKCHQNAITIERDLEGFLRPKINEDLCIKCNLCREYCVGNNYITAEQLPLCYLAWNKSDEIRYNSSSGGMFYTFASHVLNAGGMVIGAAYDEDFYSIKHISIDSEKDIIKLQKSKYLQSDICHIFSAIENNRNKLVLFVGTPCQCAAIKKAFHDMNNLIIIDLICHGVQSPAVYKDALRLMESKQKSKCVFVDFRSKKDGWAYACKSDIRFANGKTVNKRINDIPIGVAFLRNLSLRKCCEDCQYRHLYRVSDITIGDFWAMRDDPIFLKSNGDIGFSSVLVHTKKGEELMDSVKGDLNIFEKSIDDVKNQNNPLWKQFQPNPNRDAFFDDYKRLAFKEVYKKWMRPNYNEIFRWKIKTIKRSMGLVKVLNKSDVKKN